jgi:hypothetical protein
MRRRRERRTQPVRVVPASVTEGITSIVMSIPVNIIFLISIVLWTVSTSSSSSTTTIFQGVMSFSQEIIGGTIIRRNRNEINIKCLRVTVPPVPVRVDRNIGLSMVLGETPIDDGYYQDNYDDDDDDDEDDDDDDDDDDDYDGSLSTNQNRNHYQHTSSSSDVVTEFETSLAIIPPIEDWDKLQRARHYARDPVFHEWPPAIRLFHPFDKSPNAAFDVAQVIEDLEIESFNITLDSWVIVPNIEATKKEWENQKMLPDVEESGTLDSYYEQLNQESDKEVQELILSEERKAKDKAMKKYDGMSSAQQKKQDANSFSGPPSRVKKSPAEKRDEQRKMIEDDFGGPCILCLEPNEESKEMLSELRESLREGLDLDSYSSPSSLYSWEFVEDGDMGYRPLIPISKYNSLQSAMDVARRLKGLWGDPLVIEVKCLEIISCKRQDETMSIDDPSGDEEWGDIPLPTNHNGPQDSSQFEWKKDAWGRNAKIMLVGEEVDQDEEANEKMIEQLLESGETGGGDISVDYTILDDEEEENDSNIIKWLDEEDDDFDEGTHVIIGRTHFFTGDQRNYQGMPATSVVDAKDRSLGEAGAVSGLARRRGVPCRKQNVWDDGEYGRRNKDFMPWGLRERKEKQKYTWIEETE